MACGCVAQLPTYLQAGAGVAVTGLGTEQQPYVITAATTEAALNFVDTTTVDLSKTGAGTVVSPFQVSAVVKLDAQGGIVSGPSGLGVAIDTNPGNILTLTSSGKLRASGSAAVLIADDGGLRDTEFGLAMKLDPASPVPIELTTAGLKVGPVDATGPASIVNNRLSLLLQILRHQEALMGGGAHRANTGYVQWSQPFYAIAPRKTGLQNAVFYKMDPPVAGQVITGVGGATNKTVPAAGNYSGMVPLADWESIWYLVPTASAVTDTVQGNYRVAGYSAVSDLPDNAVLVAYRSGTSDKTVTWGDRQSSVPWNLGANPISAEGQNGVGGGALNLGSGGSQSLWWRVLDGMLEVDMFVVWGSGATAPPGNIYWDLPVAAKNPAHNLNKVAHNQVGWGKFFSSASGGKAAMDWQVIPYIAGNSQRIYFTVPTAGNDTRLLRFRIWNGITSPGTGTPYISEGELHTMSSELQAGMRFPFDFPYHP